MKQSPKLETQVEKWSKKLEAWLHRYKHRWHHNSMARNTANKNLSPFHPFCYAVFVKRAALCNHAA